MIFVFLKGCNFFKKDEGMTETVHGPQSLKYLLSSPSQVSLPTLV